MPSYRTGEVVTLLEARPGLQRVEVDKGPQSTLHGRSALIGAVAASAGGGVPGYGAAYRVVGIVAVVMVFLTLGLKSRQQELATVQKNN